MKRIMPIAVGLIILMIIAICPLPMMLGIPGMAWRAIIGIAGCISFALGVYKMHRKK